MSNTLIIDSLNTLFSMSNTAVIGAQEQFVAFMNPAAQELFRGNRTNHKLTELLPAHITEATATEFVTSATIEKRHVIISVTSFGAFRLFSFVPQDENALRAGAQFAPFLASLNAFRTLTTYFSDYAMQLSDVRFRRNAAELTQFYYRLLRFTLNASTASGLYDGTLAFMPQLCDLGKECRTLLDNIQPITDANGIVLEVSIPDEPINCALDTALIQRMLLNIIANCTERCKHGDRIRFTVTQEGDHADITILDDGVRIPPEKLGTIFIPLRVTGVDFSDLSSNSFGLTVALGIAEKHDGTILLESNEWGGTTFHVVLSTVLPETNLFRAPKVPYGHAQEDPIGSTCPIKCRNRSCKQTHSITTACRPNGQHAVFLFCCQVTRAQRRPLGRANTKRLRQKSVHTAVSLRDRIARSRQERRVRAVKRADDLPLRLAQVIVHDRRQQTVGRGGHALVGDQVVFHDDRPVHTQRRQQQHRADTDAVFPRRAVVEQRAVRLREQKRKKLPVVRDGECLRDETAVQLAHERPLPAGHRFRVRDDGRIGVGVLLARQAGRRLLHDRAVDILHARQDTVRFLLPLEVRAEIHDRSQRIFRECLCVRLCDAGKFAAAQQQARPDRAAIHGGQAAEVARIRRAAQQPALRGRRVVFHFAVSPPRLLLWSCS